MVNNLVAYGVCTYTLYGNLGSEVRVILNVTFDLQVYKYNIIYQKKTRLRKLYKIEIREATNIFRQATQTGCKVTVAPLSVETNTSLC